MKLLKNILFATDFSRSSAQALSMCIDVAKTLGSQVFLLHVIENGHLPDLTLNMVKSAAIEALEKIGYDLHQNGIKVPHKFVLNGVPFDKIIKYADFYNVNLVIIGSGDFAKNEPFPLGLTAQKVVRKSAKPVWVVKNYPEKGIQRIICPVDFSEVSEKALQNAIHFARNFESELLVTHVVEPITGGFIGGIAFEEDQDDIFETEQQQFLEFLEKFDFFNIQWHHMLKRGPAFASILETIDSYKPDLLIMGSTGRVGISRLLLGSVAEKVTRQLPCSFIVEKQDEPIQVITEAKHNDLQSLYAEGNELLEKEFLRESIEEFEQCLNIDLYYEPAWTALSIAYDRLGDTKNAEHCRKRAMQIHESNWKKKVRAEIRSKSAIFNKTTKHF